MIKRMIIMVVAVVLIVGALFRLKLWGFDQMKAAYAGGPPPQTVATVKASLQDWVPEYQAVASLRSEKGTDLSLQLAGVVDSITFNSGDEVPAGTVLLKLRAADDIAKLQSLQAQADLAAITAQRDEKQFKVQAVSQAVVDADEANLRNAKALVAQQQALVDYKVLRAPFSGRLGIRQVDLGQYLNAGTTVVTLQNLDSIVADFWVPQEALAKITVGELVSAHVDTFPDEAFKGKIIAIDPHVSTDSRNAQVRARLDNSGHKLLPGMFSHISVGTGEPEHLVTLPQTTLAYNSYGATVFVVHDKGEAGKPAMVAEQIFVTTGQTRGDQVAILKGVNVGDTIVSAGQIKLHNGSPVVVNNAVQPLNDANPHPNDQ